ncbi:WD repeat protein [Pelomyxa schiedti]|nr:WD repeat protein [Pelomyxa schiedti]
MSQRNEDYECVDETYECASCGSPAETYAEEATTTTTTTCTVRSVTKVETNTLQTDEVLWAKFSTDPSRIIKNLDTGDVFYVTDKGELVRIENAVCHLPTPEISAIPDDSTNIADSSHIPQSLLNPILKSICTPTKSFPLFTRRHVSPQITPVPSEVLDYIPGTRGDSSLTVGILEWDPTGTFLATSGHGCKGTLKIWERLTSEPRSVHNGSSANTPCVLQGRFFKREPKCIFRQHTDCIVTIAWSSHLVASASMDKTVRVWNISLGICVGIFDHPEIPTCAAFCASADHALLTSCLDNRLRLWNITDGSLIASEIVDESVTALTIAPGGSLAILGSVSGNLLLCNLSLPLKIEGKKGFSSRKKGITQQMRKITGLRVVRIQSEASFYVLSTSSDSRLRLYSRDGTGLELISKYKGFTSGDLHLSASVSNNGKHIACGSENGCIHLWGNQVPIRKTSRHAQCSQQIPVPGNTTVLAASFVPNTQGEGLLLVSLNAHGDIYVFN